jgi:hypothetical protein
VGAMGHRKQSRNLDPGAIGMPGSAPMRNPP